MDDEVIDDDEVLDWDAQGDAVSPLLDPDEIDELRAHAAQALAAFRWLDDDS